MIYDTLGFRLFMMMMATMANCRMSLIHTLFVKHICCPVLITLTLFVPLLDTAVVCVPLTRLLPCVGILINKTRVNGV